MRYSVKPELYGEKYLVYQGPDIRGEVQIPDRTLIDDLLPKRPQSAVLVAESEQLEGVAVTETPHKRAQASTGRDESPLLWLALVWVVRRGLGL